MKKTITTVLRCLILTLIAISFLTGCRANDTQLQKGLETFSQILKKENLSTLQLKIYYIDPSILTRTPLSVEDLISSSIAYEIVVESEQLNDHIEILNQINADRLIPVKHKSYLHARLCCIFETEGNERVLSIAVGGDNGSVFVNDVEVEKNDLFRNIIKPFVTEDVLNDLEYIFRGEYNKTGDGSLS